MKKIINTADLGSSIGFKGVNYTIKPHGEIVDIPDDVAYVWKKNHPFLRVVEMPEPNIEAIIAPVAKEVEEKEVKKVVKKPIKVEVKKIKKLLKVISKKRGRSKKKK